jgi:hypothetical protein
LVKSSTSAELRLEEAVSSAVRQGVRLTTHVSIRYLIRFVALSRVA